MAKHGLLRRVFDDSVEACRHPERLCLPSPDNRRMTPTPFGLGRLSAAQKGAAAALTTIVVWTSFIIISRASAAHTLQPFDLALLRYLGAGVVLLPWGLWLVARQRGQPGMASSFGGFSPLPFGLSLGLGLTGGVLFGLFSFSAFFLAPAGHASVFLTGSLPLWSTLVAWIWLHEQIGARRALGLLLILVGDAVVGWNSLRQAFDGSGVWRGDLCFMATAFSWACYSVMLKRHQVDPVRATIATTVVALVILVPAYALAWALGWITSALPQASWSEMGFQAFFQGAISVVVSGISFSQMVRHYGPVRTSMITSVVPSTSAMCAVLILGEPLNAHLVGGLVCVTLGILAGVWAAKPAPAKAP